MSVTGGNSQEMLFIIYRVKSIPTGKIYIGQTRDRLCNRWAKHVYTAKNYPDRGSPALHAAIRKYGKDAFEVSVLAHASSLEEANKLELHLIANSNCMAPVGYNVAYGGKNTPRSPETRAKISRAHKGRPKTNLQGVPRSAETREKIAAAKKGKQPRGTGWHHSPETRAKLSKAWEGRR